MVTTVNKTDGTNLTNIADEVSDTASTPLALLGKNYRGGYSKPVAENWVKMLENFRNSAAPTQALSGQLWYNPDTQTLNLNVGGDGTSQNFVPIVSGSQFASWDPVVINGFNAMALILRDSLDNLEIISIYSIQEVPTPMTFTVPAPPAIDGRPKTFIAEGFDQTVSNNKLAGFQSNNLKPGLNFNRDLDQVIDMGRNRIDELEDPTDLITTQSDTSNIASLTKPYEAINRRSLQRGLDTKLALAGTNGVTGPMTGDIDMGGRYLVNHPTPTTATGAGFDNHSVNKAYVDERMQNAINSSNSFTASSSVVRIESANANEIEVINGTTPVPQIGLPQHVIITNTLTVDNAGKGPIPGTTVDPAIRLNGPGLHSRIRFGGEQTIFGGDGTNGGNGTSLAIKATDPTGQIILSGETIIVAEGGNEGGLNVFSGNSYPNIQLNGDGSQARISFGNMQVIYGGANLDLAADTPGGQFLSNGIALSTGDYGEYFESVDGTSFEPGTTVVLQNNKIIPATSNSEDVIGVIRAPGTSTVGNSAWDGWYGQYLTNEWGEIQTETQVRWEWFETDGDGITSPKSTDVEANAPNDAKRVEYKSPIMNPDYDPNQEYIPRSQRPEWNIVGLIGQVLIRKGQPVNPRWRKMRDISSTIEEWFIR